MKNALTRHPLPARDASANSFPELVTAMIGRRLVELESAYHRQGASLARLGTAADLAERMLAIVPEPSDWNEAVGPFYGSSQVARLLGGISRQAVADRRERATLLGLKTADGAWVYPCFQFGDDHEVLPGLPEVLRILQASGVDEWTLTGWLMSPLRSLDGHSAIAWLREGRDREPVLAAARDAAAGFAS